MRGFLSSREASSSQITPVPSQETKFYARGQPFGEMKIFVQRFTYSGNSKIYLLRRDEVFCSKIYLFRIFKDLLIPEIQRFTYSEKMKFFVQRFTYSGDSKIKLLISER